MALTILLYEKVLMTAMRKLGVSEDVFKKKTEYLKLALLCPLVPLLPLLWLQGQLFQKVHCSEEGEVLIR